MQNTQYTFGQEGELESPKEPPKSETEPVETKSILQKKTFNLEDVRKLTENQLISLCFHRIGNICHFFAPDPFRCSTICSNYCTFDQRMLKALTRKRIGNKLYVHILDLIPILHMFRGSRNFKDGAIIQYQNSLKI